MPNSINPQNPIENNEFNEGDSVKFNKPGLPTGVDAVISHVLKDGKYEVTVGELVLDISGEDLTAADSPLARKTEEVALPHFSKTPKNPLDEVETALQETSMDEKTLTKILSTLRYSSNPERALGLINQLEFRGDINQKNVSDVKKQVQTQFALKLVQEMPTSAKYSRVKQVKHLFEALKDQEFLVNQKLQTCKKVEKTLTESNKDIRADLIFNPSKVSPKLKNLGIGEREHLSKNQQVYSDLALKNWMHLYEKPEEFIVDAKAALEENPEHQKRLEEAALGGIISPSMYEKITGDSIEIPEETTPELPRDGRTLSSALQRGSDADVHAVANSITALTSAAAKRLKPLDFRCNQDSKSAKILGHEHSVAASSDNFNEVASLVRNAILARDPPSIKSSKKSFEFFRKVRDTLINNGDYQGALAVQAAIGNSSISRFNFKDNTANAAETLFSLEGNSKNFRAATKARVENGASIVPFNGVRLTDITFTADGNPLGVEKALLIDRLVEEVEQEVRHIPDIENVEVDLSTAIEELPKDAENLEYQLSLALKPRDDKKADPEKIEEAFKNLMKKAPPKKVKVEEETKRGLFSKKTFALFVGSTAVSTVAGSFFGPAGVIASIGVTAASVGLILNKDRISASFKSVTASRIASFMKDRFTTPSRAKKTESVAKPALEPNNKLTHKWMDGTGKTYATEECVISDQLKSNLELLHAKSDSIRDELQKDPHNKLLNARLDAVESRIVAAGNGDKWLGSNAFRDHLKADGFDKREEFSTALVNARIHSQEVGGKAVTIARFGVMSDMTDGFFSAEFFNELQESYGTDENKFISLIQEKQAVLKKYESKKLSANQKAAIKDASDFLATAGTPNFKAVLDQRQALRNDKLEEQALQFLQLQLGSASKIDPKKPLVLVDNRWLNTKTAKLDKTGWMHSEENEFRDHRHALSMLDGKKIAIAENGRPRIEGDKIYLTKELAENLAGMDVKADCTILSPQTNQENSSFMKEHNKAALRRLEIATSTDIIDAEEHNYGMGVDLLEKQVKAQEVNSNILISNGCLSAKDRTGVILGALFKRLRGGNPTEDYLDSKGIAARIVHENTGSTTLKTHHYVVLSGELPETNTAQKVRQLYKLANVGLDVLRGKIGLTA